MQARDHRDIGSATGVPEQEDAANLFVACETVREFFSAAGEYVTNRALLRHMNGDFYLRTVIRLRLSDAIIYDGLASVDIEDALAMS